MHTFQATLDIIGINPFVFVPEPVLDSLFRESGKTKGHIPIAGTLNGKPFRQTLVRYAGEWRLYVNTTMLKNSPKRIGEMLAIEIAFDPDDRTTAMPPEFREALDRHADAAAVFEALSPSRQHEIVRYLARLKSEEVLQRNIVRAIAFLQGKERFAGREKP